MTRKGGQVHFYVTPDGAVKLDDATREQLIEWLVETAKERDRLVKLREELSEFIEGAATVMDNYKGGQE